MNNLKRCRGLCTGPGWSRSLAIVVWVLVSGLWVFGQSVRPNVLPVGKKFEREIKGGEVHYYAIELKKGQVLQIDAEEKNTDIVLLLGFFEDQGEHDQIIRRTDLGFGSNRETLTVIIEKADVYVLAIGSKPSEPAGRYEMIATVKNEITDRDKALIEAQRLFGQAIDILNKEGDKKLDEVITTANGALPLWKALGEKYWEAYTSGFIGVILIEAGKDAEAVGYFASAAPIWEALGDKGRESMVLASLGGCYLKLANYVEAESSFENALELAIMVGDIAGQTKYLTRLAEISQVFGANERARVYTLAATLRPAFTDIQMITGLQKTSDLPASLGAFYFALEVSKLALLYARAAGKEIYAAEINANLADIYISLDQIDEALVYANTALGLYQKQNDAKGIASILMVLSEAYLRAGNGQKALELADQYLAKLPIDRKTNNAYARLAGAAYVIIGKPQAALPLLNKALLSNTFPSDVLIDLMATHHALGDDRLAVFYGKQAVRELQETRAISRIQDQQKIAVLSDGNAQKMFLKSNERFFKRLGKLLLQYGRLGEAQEVIAAMSDQQFMDLDPTRSEMPTLSTTPREKLWNIRFAAASKVRKDLYWDLFDKTLDKPDRKQKIAIAATEKRIARSDHDFLILVQNIETDFGKPVSEDDALPVVKRMSDAQETLARLNQQTTEHVVMVYQLVGEHSLDLLVITPTAIKTVSTPINGSTLNRRVLELWALLQSPAYDPRKLGHEIYDIVFKPLEEVLPKDTTTIMWSPDDNLRYVPVGSLWDGSRYLAERFNHVVFTRADSERLTRNVSSAWTGLGFGTSEPASVEIGNERISFGALPGVKMELDAVFRSGTGGVIDGEVLADGQFTKTSFFEALKKHRPLVHIASHFSFRPGQEGRSFLLLGDGTALTLQDMKREKDLFLGVELLTLSACNTAAQRAGATGQEVDGFAELAQRLGAGAVMATLWSVSDASTPWLMRDFYTTRQRGAGASKAAALRNAQMALINGTADTKPLPATEKGSAPGVRIVITPDGKRDTSVQARADIIYVKASEAAPFKVDQHKPFAHPYYWAPFILIGNWK